MGVGAFDLLDDYRQAAALFGEHLSLVGDDDWASPTPCDDWDVRSLVSHLIVGESLASAQFRGEGGAPVAEVDTSVLGPSPMATWRGTAIGALDAAAADGVLDAVYAHPDGDFTGSVIVGFRITDNLVHAWDLARACGADIELPEGLAARCLDFWLPLVDVLTGTGASGTSFAEPVLPPDDSPAGVRLLALLGRSA
ncbi:MAG: TIGR03086 family metal-binding protein [Acidimicrobiales bacterium]|nr:TIGR03086 family metal-binding protein [Acidimicrobiales bacterium]